MTAQSPTSVQAGLSPLMLNAALGGSIVVLAVLSLLIGPAGFGLPSGDGAGLIVREIRLPRTLLALLTGGALGLAGAALQGYLRNPLAEPGIIGISSGAGLGAVLAIHSGASAALAFALPLGGLIGGALATVTVLGLAGERGGALTLILAGVAVSSVATALISFVLSMSHNPFAAVEIVFWLLGSLVDRSMMHVWMAGPLILAGIVVLLSLGPSLDALTLGEDAAQNLGIDLRRVRLLVVVGTALAVGASTAIVGMIAFVGLVVPHVLRPLVGHAPSRLLPASLLGGAALVLASDIVLRIIAPGGEVRLGVLTALMGAPFFLWLVLKLRAELGP